jgi:hypothetical protein
MGACSKSTAPAQTASNEAPIHETQSLPTSSSPEPVPTMTSTVAPIKPPPVAATASASSGASGTKGDKLSRDECGKLVHKFAENVAVDKGGELKEGFEKVPIYQTMVDDCVANGTRKQYDCVMKSKTMQDWLGCMK